jgi:hypothetical protein
MTRSVQHLLLLLLLCVRAVYAVGNRERYFNATFLQQDDLPEEREALIDLYSYTSGSAWEVGQPPGQQAWLQAWLQGGVSYCRWATSAC